jgi:hypothetical protein
LAQISNRFPRRFNEITSVHDESRREARYKSAQQKKRAPSGAVFTCHSPRNDSSQREKKAQEEALPQMLKDCQPVETVLPEVRYVSARFADHQQNCSSGDCRDHTLDLICDGVNFFARKARRIEERTRETD